MRHTLTIAVVIALFFAPYMLERESSPPAPPAEDRKAAPKTKNSASVKAAGKQEATSTSAPTARGPNPFWELAAFWAPAIENDTSRDEYENDFITRVDFDADFDATNNWDHRHEWPLPGAAYWWVVQTRTHAYLGYAFYRLANGDSPPDLNEMQGAIVVIRRSPTPLTNTESDMGRFEALLIWSHGRYETFVEFDTSPDNPELAKIWNDRLKPAGSIDRAGRKVAGDINFIVDSFGVHPVLYSEADSHQLSEAPGSRSGGAGFFDETLTDWRSKDYLERRATAGHTWGQMRGIPQDGVMYVFANQGVLPVVGMSGKGRGRYKHHWELVGYELVGLNSLWGQRDRKELFVDAGMFAGDGRHRGLHLAPWAWSESTDGLEGLDPVRNPGALIATLVKLPAPFDPKPIARSFELE